VVKSIDPEQFWADCFKFLTIENKFIKEENILMLKDDSYTLASMYRLYSIYYLTKLLVSLGQIARKYGEKNIALPSD